MKVAVCVKQIPDPAVPGELDPSTNTLKRDDKLILDESDSYGVELALQLVEAAGGGSVTLVSMAPRGEVSGLRTALAMGADDAVLGPAPDGGYWAIGLKRTHPLPPGLFDGVRWSSPHALADTRAGLGDRRVAFLPPLRDVDTAADLKRVST